MSVLFIASDASFRRQSGSIQVDKAAIPLLHLKAAGYEVRHVVSPHYRRVNSFRHPELIRLRLRFHLSSALRSLFLPLRAESLRDGLMNFLKERWFQARTDWFFQFLKKNQTECVLGIGLSTPELSACDRLQIPTFEFQHGRVTDHALQRGFPTDAKPDYFMFWFKEDEPTIRRHGMHPLFVGMPRVLVGLPQTSSARAGQEALLVLLQNKFSNSIDGLGHCHTDVEGAILNFQSMRPDLKIHFRGHPAVSRREQVRVFSALSKQFTQATFEVSHDRDIAETLAHVSGVLSYSSSTWTESIPLYVPHLILDDWSREDALSHFPKALHWLLPGNVADFVLSLDQNTRPGRGASLDVAEPSAGMLEMVRIIARRVKS